MSITIHIWPDPSVRFSSENGSASIAALFCSRGNVVHISRICIAWRRLAVDVGKRDDTLARKVGMHDDDALLFKISE